MSDTIKRVGVDQAGCWIEGSRGRYGRTYLLDIALSYGWRDGELTGDELAAYECDADSEGCGDPTCYHFEHIADMMDSAEAWMNEHVAAEGYQFGWHDGEFYLWSDEDWADNSY